MYLLTGDYAAAKLHELRNEAERGRMLGQLRSSSGSPARADRDGRQARRFMAGLKYLLQAQL